jgi:hypothetical protein
MGLASELALHVLAYNMKRVMQITPCSVRLDIRLLMAP